MKFGIKKKFLATAICLALSTGSAFAMPSGGSVQSGDISGVDAGTLIDGATITAMTNGVINWESFSIANGETLNFALNNNTLLNRVTGTQLSELLGTLNADSGNLILSNPNGILVGANATINANRLMLTTLNIDDSAVNTLLNNRIANLTNGNSSKGVEFQGGGTGIINVARALDVVGGTVTVADGVNITGKKDIHLIAADTATIPFGEGKFAVDTAAGNDVKIGAANITASEGGAIVVFGSKVDMTKAALNATAGSKAQDIMVAAGSSMLHEDSSSTMTLTTTTGNDVTITGSTINNSSVPDSKTSIYGSSVTVKDSTVKSNGDIELFALKSYTEANHGKKIDFAADANVNKLTVDSSTISSAQSMSRDNSDAVMFGGSIDITGTSKIEAPANAGHDIFALSSAKVDGATDTFELKANANNKLTIADTVTLTGGNNGPQHNLPGVYAGSVKIGNGTEDTVAGEKKITVNGKDVWASIYNNYTPTPTPTPTPPEPTPEPVLDETLPTGGNVTVGSVTIGENTYTGAASGASINASSETIKANDNSVIDWSTFNVGKDATLTFNSNGYVLLNRVSGGNAISTILGKIVDDNNGSGRLIISNPNGIVVGNGAAINANSLMLTTLPINDTQFQSLMSGNSVSLTTDSGKAVTLQKNAKIEASGLFSVYAGKIDVADGVTVTGTQSASSDHVVTMVAGNEIEMTSLASGFGHANINNTAENSINMGKASIGKAAANNGIVMSEVNIVGGSVSLDGTEITASTNDGEIKGQSIRILAANLSPASAEVISNKDNQNVTIKNANLDASNALNVFVQGNNVNIENSTIKAEDSISISGNKGNSIKDSTIATSIADWDSIHDASIEINSGKGIVDIQNTIISTDVADGNNIELSGVNVNISGLSRIASGDLNIIGNAVTIADSNINVKNEANIAAVSERLEDGTLVAETSKNKVILTNNALNAAGINVFGGKVKIDDKLYNVEGEYSVGNYKIKVTVTDKGVEIGDVSIDTDSTTEEINNAAQQITTSDQAVEVLKSVLSEDNDFTNEQKVQVVKAVIESSPVMATKNQEIKNQDAASQAASADNAASPVDTGAGVSAGSDNGTDSAVSVDGGNSDNESEE